MKFYQGRTRQDSRENRGLTPLRSVGIGSMHHHAYTRLLRMRAWPPALLFGAAA